MTTRKLVIIVASIVIGVGLLVGIFTGAIAGFVFYSVGNSEAANTAKDFLRKNDQLKQDIGEVKDFGSIVTGSINVHDVDGEATLRLKVIGERKVVWASIDLMYRSGRKWRVTTASYTDRAGQTVELLNPYGARLKFRVSS